MRPIRLLAAVLAIAASLAVAACGSSTDSNTASSTTAATAASCSKDQLALTTPGTLTVGTDKPAYPPYFEDDKPSNGKGFESAVAYAIAKQLGFAPADVTWKVVPFNSSYAPGPKSFDFDINQISITPKRATRVDFSTPYYTAPQAVLALKSSKAANATSLADLKDTQLGVQIGTTSLSAVNDLIKPTNQVKVYNTSNDVVNALKDGLVDGIVTDLPTAFYITSAQLPNTAIAGQFSAPGGDTWGLLLQKKSALTTCVSAAVNTLRANGTLKSLTDKWMSSSAGAPKLN